MKPRLMLPLLFVAALPVLGNVSVRSAEKVTTVRLTDRVLVEDCIRFGINLGSDAYYSGAALVKKRVRQNFEGTTYRQCHFGPLQDEKGATTWFSPPEQWRRMLIGGGRYTILSGPARGTSGTIRDITTKQAKHQGEMKDFPYFVFDKLVPAGPPNTGVLVEAFRLKEGDFRRFESHDYWTSLHNRVVQGDVPPGSFGVSALLLPGAEKRAHVRFATHYQRYGETNGTWHYHFWAKATKGQPELTLSSQRSDHGESRTVKPPSKWTKYELLLPVNNVPEPTGPDDNPHLTFLMTVEGGDVLIDDVEAWLEGDQNPTVFRDDVVSMLKRYRPGVLRYLQMGGNTVRNTLMPPLKAHAFTSRRMNNVGPYNNHSRAPYSLHQMYELCELVGAEPWYCLPGTLQYDEMERFMEYLGAPADVGYGSLRAELGHPQPWTEVFKHIHVEFGNEAWNNAGPYQCGGFNGRNYWQDLISIGKSSPYYAPNVVFHAAGQAANSWLNRGIVERVPNADRFGVAPYILHSLNRQDLEVNDTNEKLFRWVFAWPIWRSRDERGAMYQNHQITDGAGMEMSIYEVNHHTTHGDAPLEARNRIVTSLGGGLNVCNNMLLMLKDHGLRTQCLFSLVQHGYRAESGVVRLWGTALNMRQGHERYRPTFLACATANRVIGGDLIETVHSGGEPTFEATGMFSRHEGVETMHDVPCLWTYAFHEGDRRGLIIANLDVADAHRVAVQFEGEVTEPARQWLLTAKGITASNEFEFDEPQVRVQETQIEPFGSGAQLTVPAHSLMALQWRVR